ncbi:glycine cleavage system protein GcvH [Nakamurella sp. A5-74]|uniref:Glycine cleavage system H protein n=1 Tax=Nakamurella sp. A5-74 TaxID=3158264 RepID=A0AAU8DKJ5_9ACTN
MIPEDLQYSSDHEWVRTTSGDAVRIGITDFAQGALGDIVYVQLPDLGSTFSAGDTIGEVESTKSVSDLFAPVGGTIVTRNEALDAAPETVNSDPYGDGWMVEIQLDDPAELESLMDADAYGNQVGGE